MASRFWVGGTGTWDASTTTNWSATTGGAGGASVPGAADTVTFDGASGGGTVTVNTNFTVVSMTWGAFTGTIDFATNNNSPTFSANSPFSGTGSGTRTFNAGSGTFTFTGTASPDFTTTTGLTWNPGTATWSFSVVSPTTTRTFITGGLTFANITIAGTNKGFNFTITGAATFTTFVVTGQNNIVFPSATTTTIGTLNANGISGAPMQFASSSITATATVALTTVTNANWIASRLIAYTGSPTLSSAFDLGGNTGATINVPSGGGSTGLPASRVYLGAN